MFAQYIYVAFHRKDQDILTFGTRALSKVHVLTRPSFHGIRHSSNNNSNNNMNNNSSSSSNNNNNNNNSNNNKNSNSSNNNNSNNNNSNNNKNSFNSSSSKNNNNNTAPAASSRATAATSPCLVSIKKPVCYGMPVPFLSYEQEPHTECLSCL